jgi:hypothetical protein
MIRSIVGLLFTRCQHCRSVEFRRVGTRNEIEKALYWLLQPCRCTFCGHHIFLFRWHAPIESSC